MMLTQKLLKMCFVSVAEWSIKQKIENSVVYCILALDLF